jgi:hypothetical protein
MKKALRLVSITLAFLMIFSLILTACDNPVGNGEETTEETTGGQTWNPEDEYKLPLEDGYNQLTLYWTYNGTYENCDIWIWWGDKAGQGYTFHECSYGAKVVINVPEGVEEVGFIVRRDCSEPGGSSWGSATKDFEQDRFSYDKSEESSDALDKYFSCDLLIIDDLGTELINQFSTSCLYNVINSRLIRKKSTIINTNFTRDELRKKYHDRITSRIFGEYTVLPFLGTDIREKKILKK